MSGILSSKTLPNVMFGHRLYCDMRFASVLAAFGESVDDRLEKLPLSIAAIFSYWYTTQSLAGAAVVERAGLVASREVYGLSVAV